MSTYKPKLIEVALPLAVINAEAAREKSIRHGHPSTLHLWWARRPLAAARAVIWSSLVDDPSGDDTLTVEEQDTERQRLFGILEKLVKWENSNNPEILAAAKAEIDRCFPDGAPPILDPFGGGRAIPLEAQRLGLKALSGDLNPVAVLIQKAMIEIPPRFSGRPPVHPGFDSTLNTWQRAQGMAADISAYGKWMRDEAHKRIGHLYPDATGPNGEKLTPIAWIWARTVKSPDPAWNGHVPLVASWTLAAKVGKDKVWIEPVVNTVTQSISYGIRTGGEPSHLRSVNGGNGVCLATGATISGDIIKAEGRAGKLSAQMMAVVAEGSSGRSYCEATAIDIAAAGQAEPNWKPAGRNPEKLTGGTVFVYGLDEWWKLFTPRQLTALTTFSDLLPEVRERVLADWVAGNGPDDGIRLRNGGSGASAYADAIVTYLAFVIDKCTDYWSSICTWNTPGEKMRNTFGRQAIPMTWDFAECNPFSSSSGNWMAMVDWVWKAVQHLPATEPGATVQRDARARVKECVGVAISTDPPYYDNISYADLSDYFFHG
jgi:putative DNA methylase